MSKSHIKFFFSFLFFTSFFTLGFLFSKKVNNIEAKEPTEPIVDYQTYRPHPKDPAYKELEDLSLLCGNDMIINKKFEVTPGQGSCTQSGTTLTCAYVFEENVRVAVDTSHNADTRLPIMGNTQLVYNLENKIGVGSEEELDDTEKVNNLVSWYLNGAINYAENPHPITNLGTVIEEWWTGYYGNVINFAGPLRKLLPQDVQYQNKIEQIENATGSNSGTELERYDQIVGCTYGVSTPLQLVEDLANGLLNILGFDEIEIIGSSVFNVIGPCSLDLGFLGLFVKPEEHRLSEFKNKLPPLNQGYVQERQWWREYNIWRGKSCIVIPGWFFIPDKLKYQGICFQNPLRPDYIADLFMNIPLSSTEDRVGKLTINQPTPGTLEDGKAEILEFQLESPATLYFPHMQESLGLSEQLQSTFVPEEGTNNSLGYTEPVDISSNCQILQVRTNEEKDDYLWGDEALAKFKYKAEFECKFKQVSKQVCSYGVCWWETKYDPEVCEKKLTFTSKIDTYTPLADEVWARLVAGNSSVARMMFPKTGTGSIGEFIDIPTVTSAQYKVELGDVTVSPSTAEIYFPHIGGISEYFLKGIQTLLRPKGYGETISFGTKPSEGGSGQMGTCALGTGPCSVENLLPYFGNDLVKASNASMICNMESGSNPNATNKGCLTGTSVDYSIGLFQINLLAHGNANQQNIEYSWNPISCTIINPSGVTELEKRFLNPTENIKYAVTLSRNGTNWSAWKAASAACGIQ